MMIWMGLLIIYIGFQRISESKLSRRNEKWLVERGGVIKFDEKLKWYTLLHSFIYFIIFFEVFLTGKFRHDINLFLFLILIGIQFFRFWCIRSLGKFWNMKNIVLPGVLLFKKGPYKYTKYPDKISAVFEMIIIALLFWATFTAIIYAIISIYFLRGPSKDIIPKASV